MDLFTSFQKLPIGGSHSNVHLKQTRSSTEGNRAGGGHKNSGKLEAACTEFESLFIYYMLKEMRSTINKSGYFDGGKAEELYTSMMDTHLAKKMSVERGVGIAKMLRAQLEGGPKEDNP